VEKLAGEQKKQFVRKEEAYELRTGKPGLLATYLAYEDKGADREGSSQSSMRGWLALSYLSWKSLPFFSSHVSVLRLITHWPIIFYTHLLAAPSSPGMHLAQHRL
jgi:hypothetical protein